MASEQPICQDFHDHQPITKIIGGQYEGLKNAFSEIHHSGISIDKYCSITHSNKICFVNMVTFDLLASPYLYVGGKPSVPAPDTKGITNYCKNSSMNGALLSAYGNGSVNQSTVIR